MTPMSFTISSRAIDGYMTIHHMIISPLLLHVGSTSSSTIAVDEVAQLDLETGREELR